MGQVSAYLRSVSGPLTRGFAHWCPGCNELHVIQVYADSTVLGRATWTFDGDLERPTFAPSIRITVPAWEDDNVQHPAEVCHYFLASGKLQFCADSTHPLAGQTVPLPPLPPHATDAVS